jgi:hypothetical protein
MERETETSFIRSILHTLIAAFCIKLMFQQTDRCYFLHCGCINEVAEQLICGFKTLFARCVDQ